MALISASRSTNRYNPLIRRLIALDKPVVCAVNGVAAGAGANIAFAADIVLAAKSARFIQSFSNIGLVPDSGGTWILPRLAGHARAMGLALTGEPLSAEKAEAWGLIWRAVDDDQLKEEADKLVAKLASGPTKGLAAIKMAMRKGWLASLDEQLDLERDLQRETRPQPGTTKKASPLSARNAHPNFPDARRTP